MRAVHPRRTGILWHARAVRVRLPVIRGCEQVMVREVLSRRGNLPGSARALACTHRRLVDERSGPGRSMWLRPFASEGRSPQAERGEQISGGGGKHARSCDRRGRRSPHAGRVCSPEVVVGRSARRQFRALGVGRLPSQECGQLTPRFGKLRHGQGFGSFSLSLFPPFPHVQKGNS